MFHTCAHLRATKASLRMCINSPEPALLALAHPMDVDEYSDQIWASAWDFQQCGCVTSKASDQPAHMRSPIRAFACRLNILKILFALLMWYQSLSDYQRAV